MIVLRYRDGRRATGPSRLPEWLAAAFLFALGIQLSRPGHAFALSPVYGTLGRMATERHWATAALAIATVRCVALILNGFFPVIRRVTPVLRSLAAFCGGCVWLALAVGLFLFNTSVLGVVAHAGWAALDFIYAAIVAHEAAAALRAGWHGVTRRA